MTSRARLEMLLPGAVAALPKYPAPTTKPPSHPTMAKWLDTGIAKATDGCKVEPDGCCCHGHPSWFLRMGII